MIRKLAFALLFALLGVGITAGPALAADPPPLPPGQITVPGQVLYTGCDAAAGEQTLTATATYYAKGKLILINTRPTVVSANELGEVTQVSFVTPKKAEYVAFTTTCAPQTVIVRSSGTYGIYPSTRDTIGACPAGTHGEVLSPVPLPTGIALVTRSDGRLFFVNSTGQLVMFEYVVVCRPGSPS